ncbi:MAG: prolipoprotein diacylglyceryl transferase [Alphaproteobacteria bacterium]
MFAAIPFPPIHPEVFSIPGFDLFGLHLGPFPLRWYALAYIAGLMLGWRYMVAIVKNEKLWTPGQVRPTPLQCDDFLFWATLGVIVGGRLGYVFFYNMKILWTDPLQTFAIWQGGMSFHGGLIGVTTAMVLFARKYKLPFLTLSDIVATVTPIGLFFGRIANFINGELWGRPTDVPWGVIFPNADGLPRHPSQLYECALEGVVLFSILRLATYNRLTLKRPGLTTGIFLVCYGVFRSSLENVREPDSFMPIFPFGLTMGMILSIPMIVFGGWLVYNAMKAPTPPANPANPAKA